MHGQGALEYLIIIAAVLGITAVVVTFVTGAFTTVSAGGDLAKCRLAAAQCKKDLALGVTTHCDYCIDACTDLNNLDILNGVEGGGLACELCLAGDTNIQGGGEQTIALSAQWPLDEGVGTVISDTSGSGNDGSYVGETFYSGTLINGPAWATGMHGSALSFNGINQLVATDYSGPFLQEMTISIWFKLNDWGSRAAIGRFHNTRGWDQGWMLYRNYNEGQGNFSWLFYYNNTYGKTSGIKKTYEDLLLNTWYHATAVIYPNGDWATYLDGQPYLSGTASSFLKWGGNNTVDTTQMAIGRCSRELSSWHFNGSVDAVRIWNRALSTPEILADKDLARPENRTMVDFELDEGTGGSVSDWHVWVDGVSGNALSFDGGNDYILTGYSGEFLQNLTITAWFNLDDWGSRAVAGRFHTMSTDGNQGWMLYRNSNEVTGQFAWLFYYNTTIGTVRYVKPPYLALSLGTWYHAAAVIHSDGRYVLYLNGEVHTSSQAYDFARWGGNNTRSDVKVSIGKGSESYWYFKGRIDEVMIYDRALSQLEIRNIYQNP